ncbi:MAG: OsmC family protein [Dissulfurispiraceae bacterium]
MSLADCIATIARIMSNQKRINLRSLASRFDGTVDTDVLLGKNSDKSVGFPGIDVEADIDADISDEGKKNFPKEVNAQCPVSSTIESLTPVSLRLKE